MRVGRLASSRSGGVLAICVVVLWCVFAASARAEVDTAALTADTPT
jgi:hypothetical protein